MSLSVGNANALTRLLVCTPDSATAAMTLSTALSLFRRFAFLVGESRHGDFLVRYQLSEFARAMSKWVTNHNNPLQDIELGLKANI